ncbi:MAG TPA: S16 family serine protease, partial [Syntrophales bacterium]|nr:S16 family serine protease [Syntrophales bacterium]
KDNEKDLADVPANVLKALEIIFVEHMDDVLKIALIAPEGNVEEELCVDEELISIPSTQSALVQIQTNH